MGNLKLSTYENLQGILEQEHFPEGFDQEKLNQMFSLTTDIVDLIRPNSANDEIQLIKSYYGQLARLVQ